jgi:hypothetical protein
LSPHNTEIRDATTAVITFCEIASAVGMMRDVRCGRIVLKNLLLR